MTRIFALPAVAAFVALGGCANSGSTISTSAVNANLLAAEQEVQTLSKGLCGFEPELATAAGVIVPLITKGAASPVAAEQIASTAASEICSAITAKSARRGGVFAPHVGRVPVHGRFVSGARI